MQVAPRQILLFFFNHRLLALARWDLHFMRLRLRSDGWQSKQCVGADVHLALGENEVRISGDVAKAELRKQVGDWDERRCGCRSLNSV
jgi:hypothetical protein